MTPQEALSARLTDALGEATARALVDEMERAGKAAAVLALLDELRDVSAKAAAGAIDALPELQRRGSISDVVAWLDLGVAIAASSGAAALKYWKDSPLVLGLLEPAARGPALSLALELAEDDPNVALEFFRRTPELLTLLPASDLRAWAEACADLAKVEYVLGIELVRQVPAVAQALPLDLIHPWIRFGMKLVTQNSLGKTDYVGTLEFFRTSPAIFGDIECRPVRAGVIDVGSVVAERSPQLAIDFLAEAPALLRRLPSDEWRQKVMRYAPLVAERDAEAAVNYLRRSPEIIALLGETPETQARFEQWFKGGMEVLEFSPEGGRAYFSLETKKALASVEQAMSGVPLRQVARSLKLFAQGLCGTDVAIQSLPETPEPGKEPPRATVSADGRTILLPSLLRRYPTYEENVRLYTVLAAHEAGHLEFGTYGLDLASLNDLIADVQRRYPRDSRDERDVREKQVAPFPQVSPVEQSDVTSLANLFALYPQPGVIRDLWTVLEDARVESLLRHEYPGLKADLARQAQEAIRTHTLTQGMTVREIVVDALLLLSTAEPGTFTIPDSIVAVVDRAWAQCRPILQPAATAADVVRVADRVYVLLDELLTPVTLKQQTDDPKREPETDLGVGPQASETQTDQYRPVTNWVYRGAMNPDIIGTKQGDAGEPGDMPVGTEGSGITASGASGGTKEGSKPAPTASGVGMADPHRGSGVTPDSAADQLLQVGDDRRGAHAAAPSHERVYLYDEWDGLIQDYRSRWCRVVEQKAAEATADFAELTLAAHGPAVRLLRRYFESIRPPGLRRLHGQTDGEEIDLDALIRRAADHAAGVESSDRIYIRREKRERDVAVAFLVDLSGSTSRQLETGSRRVIDVEKEGLILLCEALEAVGDQYALYGYSGRGRAQVDFVVMKEFDERDRTLPARRIGAVTPLHQNRDGAAIRHATAKLLAREARIKLLVLLSDGKPLDDGYADEYALEDTKRALREARMAGVDPFCITVDRDADDYLKRMYGDVNFLVIDRIADLPERLPRIYQKLTS
jgi:hypothetical protein